MNDVLIVGDGSSRANIAMLASALAAVGAPVSIDALAGIDARKRAERATVVTDADRARMAAAEAKRARKAAKLRKGA